MFLVSQLVDFATRLGNPRFRHRVHLMQLERWRNGELEYYLLDHLVDPSRAAVDVGANEGDFAGRMAQLCTRVHCFEPIPWLVDALRAKLDPAVIIHQCALSDRDGVAELRVPYRGEMEMHGTSTLEPGNPLAGSTYVRQVPCTLARLDDAVREPVGFMKIDVEGHELAVLDGATNTLREHQPVLLIESERRHNPEAPENIFRFLQDEGYTGVFMNGKRLRGLAAFQTEVNQQIDESGEVVKPYVNNFIFLPNR